MSHHSSALAIPNGLQAIRLMALLAACTFNQLWAAEIGDVARFNASSAPQAEIPWISGGIGDEARDEMRKTASSYNIHLMFSGRHGHYLAGIPYTVARQDGQRIHAGTSEGPLVYLKLPPGDYRIAAEIDGTWQQKRVRAGGAGTSAKLSFVARDE